MQIPKTIKIGAVKYDVKVVEGLENRSGEFDFAKCQIKIEKGKPEAMELTLMHEILHAMNNEIKEDTIEFYAQAWYQLTKENPKLFMKGGE